MSKESFLEKLNKISEFTFVLPTLQEEIRYRKLDVIESSVNGQMPNYIATRVLEVMKNGLDGSTEADGELPKATTDDVKQILIKATEVLGKVIVEPKLDMEDIVRIPSEDRIAWFLDAIGRSHTSETAHGGEVTANDVANFPEIRGGRRNAKRSLNS